MPRWFWEALNQFAARLPVRPAAYFWSFVVWLVLLSGLSASSPPSGPEIRILHLDKILHFGYFSLGEIFHVMQMHNGLKIFRAQNHFVYLRKILNIES